MEKRADQILEEMAKTNRERNAVYGDNWKMIGPVMAAFFPDGLHLHTAEEFNRFHFWFLNLVKMTRLAVTGFNHQDSAHDIGVYSAMLEALIIEDAKPKREHDLYKDFDDDAPPAIQDRNGQVCLAMCRVCGLGESQLIHHPFCEGRRK